MKDKCIYIAYNDLTNQNPINLFPTEKDLKEFIELECTIEDLQCFLDKLLEFELYEYCAIVRDKINVKRSSQKT